MKWVTLKIYLFPSIMQQIEQVTEIYINYINEIKRTNSEKTFREFEQLRESITNRIKEIEKFFENNISDSRITAFEKARSKLKKLLKYDSDPEQDNQNMTFNRLNNEMNFPNKTTNLNKTAVPTNEQNQHKSLEAKKLSVEKIPLKKAFGANSNSKGAKNRTASVENKDRIKLSKNKGKDKLNNSMLVSNNKSVSNREEKLNQIDLEIASNTNLPKDFNKKEKKDKEKVKEKEREKTVSENKQNQTSQVKGQGGLFNNLMGDGYLEFKDLAKWKEIVFKIKLTDNEYKLLVKEKANLVNIK